MNTRISRAIYWFCSLVFFLVSYQITLGQVLNTIKPVKKFSQINKGFYKPLNTLGDTNTFTINYDSADAEIWGANYIHNQVQLMNMHYQYPADSSALNSYVINSFTVAFDSLFNPYNSVGYLSDSVGSIMVDTIIIPILQVNHSGVSDTLDIQLNAVDWNGYPTGVVLSDKEVISKVIGSIDTTVSYRIVKIPENCLVNFNKFAVTVKYYGAKVDSCWFVYGFGSFTGTCGSGIYTLAETTSFSRVFDSNGAFMANSFVSYNKYSAEGYLPTKNGTMLYYNCAGDSGFVPGDGVTYFQDINVYVQVTSLPVGMKELHNAGMTVQQNYPNPFNKTTLISYSLDKSSNVSFNVSDIMGRKLLTDLFCNAAPGPHSIILDSHQFNPGVYFYTLEIEGNMVTKKMMVMQ
jgi:hypothetical protein